MPFYTKKTNKPIRNYQKKKYYNNRNTKSKAFSLLAKRENKKTDPWLDGTFMIDPLTWETKHIPKTYDK